MFIITADFTSKECDFPDGDTWKIFNDCHAGIRNWAKITFW